MNNAKLKSKKPKIVSVKGGTHFLLLNRTGEHQFTKLKIGKSIISKIIRKIKKDYYLL